MSECAHYSSTASTDIGCEGVRVALDTSTWWWATYSSYRRHTSSTYGPGLHACASPQSCHVDVKHHRIDGGSKWCGVNSRRFLTVTLRFNNRGHPCGPARLLITTNQPVLDRPSTVHHLTCTSESCSVTLGNLELGTWKSDDFALCSTWTCRVVERGGTRHSSTHSSLVQTRGGEHWQRFWHNDVGHVIGACASTRERSSCGCIRVCECDTNNGFCKSQSHLIPQPIDTAPQPCTSLVQHWPAFWQSQLLTLRPSSFLIQPTVGLYMGLWRGEVTPKDILACRLSPLSKVSSHRHTDCMHSNTSSCTLCCHGCDIVA